MNKIKVTSGFNVYTGVIESPFFHAVVMFTQAAQKGHFHALEGWAPSVLMFVGFFIKGGVSCWVPFHSYRMCVVINGDLVYLFHECSDFVFLGILSRFNS